MAESMSLTMYLKAYDQGMEAALKRVESASKTTEKSLDQTKTSSTKTGAAFAVASKMVNVGMNLITSSVGSAISRLDTLHNYPKVMKSLGYSTKDANASMKKLSDGIEGLPTSLDAIASSSQTLVASLGDINKATDSAVALNDMFLAGGQGAEAASRALVQYNQMLAKGKVDMQSWNSVVEVAPGQLDQLAKSLLGANANQRDLYAALQSGKLSVSDLNDEIIRLDKEGGAGFDSFADQAKSATGGIKTSLTNVKTAIVKGVANTIDTVNTYMEKHGMGSIQSKFDKAKDVVNKTFASIQSGTKKVLSACQPTFKAISSAVDKAKGSIKGLVKGGFDLLVTSLKIAGKVLPPVLKAVDKLSPALAAAAAATLVYKASTASLNGGLLKNISALIGNIGALGSLIAEEGIGALATTKMGMAVSSLNAALTANPFIAVAAALAGLIAMTVAASQKLSETEKATKAVKDAQNEWKSSLNDSLGDIEAQSNVADDLRGKIEKLNAKEKLSSEEKKKMRSYVSQLNTVLGEEVAHIDEVTGKTVESNEAINDSIEALKKRAKASAYYEAYEKAVKNQADAEIELAKATKRFNEENEKMSKNVGAGTADMEVYSNQVIQSTSELDNLRNTVNSAGDEVTMLEGVMNDAGMSLSECAEAAGEMSGASDELTASAETNTDAVNQNSEAYNQLKESILSAVEGFDEFNGGTEYTAEQLLSNIESMKSGLTSWGENISSIGDRMNNLQGTTEESMAKISGVSAQTKADFISYLQQLGPESANAIATLSQMTDDQLIDYIAAWQQTRAIPDELASMFTQAQTTAAEGANGVITTTSNSLMQGQGTIHGAMQGTFDAAMSGIETSASSDRIATQTTAGLSSSINAGSRTLESAGSAAGGHLVTGVKNGISSGGLGGAVQTMLNQILTATNNFRAPANTAGKGIGDSITTGFTSAKPKTIQAVTTMVNEIHKKLSQAESYSKQSSRSIVSAFNISSQMSSAGSWAMIGFNNGLRAKGNAAVATARSIASRVKSAVTMTLRIGSPSKVLDKAGQWAMIGFDNGLVRKGKNAIASAKDIASQISTPFEDGLAFAGGYSGSFEYSYNDASIDLYGNLASELAEIINDRPIEVTTGLEIDGREFAHATTGYISAAQKEQEKFEKFRRGDR